MEMMFSLAVGVVTLLIIQPNPVEGSFQISTAISSSNGFICPLTTFNCIAVDVLAENLRWYFNDVSVARYIYMEDDEYPLNVPLSTPISGVLIQIVQASFEATFTNFNSTMTANLSVLIQVGVNNISCGRTTSRSNAIYIKVPSAPVIYAVVPIYNQLSELNEVTVQWKEMPDNCSPEEILGYRVELRNASGVIVNQTEIPSGCGVCMDDQCPTPLCSTSFSFNENYSISVTAFNTFGSSPPATLKDIGSIVLLSNLSSDGLICPRTTFKCMALDILAENLIWYFNDESIALYTYEEDDEYPLNVTLSTPIPGVMIQIVQALHDATSFSYNSTMTVNLSVLTHGGVNTFRCGSTLTRSASITINNILIHPQGPPPSYSASCFIITPGPVVSLRWSTSFTSQHAVERYRVVVTPDPSSCSSQQVSPSENYTCSGLVLGNHYSFTVSAINCGNQEGTRETFTVQLQEQSTPSFSSVTAVYSSTLTLINVKWNKSENNEDHLECLDEGLNSTMISIDNFSGLHVEKTHSRDDGCDNKSICSTSFLISTPDDPYIVQISATNIYGQPLAANIFPASIPGFAYSLLNFTLTVENDTVFALCTTSLASVEECFVQYGIDPHYQKLSSPINGPVNSKFLIPIVMGKQEMVYYHQTTVKVNSSLDIIIRSSFVYDPSDVSMEVVYDISISVYQLGLIGCVFTILLLGLTTSIIVIIILLRKVRTMKCHASSISASSFNVPQPQIHETENVSGELVNNIPFVVYEEIEELTVRHAKDSRDLTAAMELKENCAYQASTCGENNQ